MSLDGSLEVLPPATCFLPLFVRLAFSFAFSTSIVLFQSFSLSVCLSLSVLAQCFSGKGTNAGKGYKNVSLDSTISELPSLSSLLSLEETDLELKSFVAKLNVIKCFTV